MHQNLNFTLVMPGWSQGNLKQFIYEVEFLTGFFMKLFCTPTQAIE